MRIVDIDNLPRHGGRGGLVYWNDIEGQVTEIVRCKDCKHYESDGGALMRCAVSGITVNDEDYCSYGERIENGNGV